MKLPVRQRIFNWLVAIALLSMWVNLDHRIMNNVRELARHDRIFRIINLQEIVK
jgi:hypothetical protein